jgi:phosphatidylglycerophosphatase A
VSPLRWIATGFGSGFFPVAPGTAGSLVGLAAWCALPGLPLHGGVATAAFLAAAFALGVIACGPPEREFGKDGGPIVFDEIVGQWITVAGVDPTPFTVIAAFVLFRAADVLKPFPAGRSQGWGGGLGVMADDVFAGLWAWAALQLLLRAFGGGA